ncbi:hypothetical protein [Amycolatopsis sp. CB00013]|uniref:hypothetical protein n=1 Tax=Amycolatopsis sp. CB00013 TaxID=1703945 RepID=UPI00093C2A6E|nr:hypothetical protein [Amycolatopsis sp. CB00013]OKJ97529.1 hypothetical protein AMK34_11140 [Amycolatopsis sp. CB00013]
MHDQHMWRGLAVTYAVVAIIQLYLGVSTGATWAGVLAAVWLLAALGSGAAARWQGHHAHDDDVASDESARGCLSSTEEELVQWAARRASDRTL